MPTLQVYFNTIDLLTTLMQLEFNQLNFYFVNKTLHLVKVAVPLGFIHEYYYIFVKAYKI